MSPSLTLSPTLSLALSLTLTLTLALSLLAGSNGEQFRTEVVGTCSAGERDALPTSVCCTTVNGGASSPNAYATVLGGVDNSYKYRGYLYNVCIAAQRLRDLGSSADVVVIIIMRPEEPQLRLAGGNKPNCSTPEQYRGADAGNPPLTALPPEDAELLRAHGVRVIYSGVMHGERLDFASLMFSKGLVWRLTEYRAVQFFDADVMPLKNMDPFFRLHRFMACAGKVSAMDAGYFRLTPSCEDYKGLRDLAVKANYWGAHGDSEPHLDWDDEVGWGARDLAWRNIWGAEKQSWDFHGGFADQGWLYYYFWKVKQEVDQLYYGEVQRITPNGTATSDLKPQQHAPFPELGDAGTP